MRCGIRKSLARHPRRVWLRSRSATGWRGAHDGNTVREFSDSLCRHGAREIVPRGRAQPAGFEAGPCPTTRARLSSAGARQAHGESAPGAVAKAARSAGRVAQGPASAQIHVGSGLSCCKGRCGHGGQPDCRARPRGHGRLQGQSVAGDKGLSGAREAR